MKDIRELQAAVALRFTGARVILQLQDGVPKINVEGPCDKDFKIRIADFVAGWFWQKSQATNEPVTISVPLINDADEVQMVSALNTVAHYFWESDEKRQGELARAVDWLQSKYGTISE